MCNEKCALPSMFCFTFDISLCLERYSIKFCLCFDFGVENCLVSFFVLGLVYSSGNTDASIWSKCTPDCEVS